MSAHQQLAYVKKIAFYSAVIALLTACGGSGGGSGSGSSASDGSIAGPLTPYLGVWKSGCEQITDTVVPTNILGSYETRYNFSTITANGAATAQISDAYYIGGTCSGASVGGVSQPVSIVADGTKIIGSPAVTTNKILITTPAGTPTFSGAASLTPSNPGQPATILVSYGDVEVTYEIPTTITTARSVLSLVTNNTFRLGETLSGLDPADGFPTTFVNGSLGIFAKQ
jgi:hypothetical protein